MHSRQRDNTLWQTAAHKSWFKLANASMTNCRRSSTLLGFLEYTRSLMTPQTQKSIGVMSGDRGGNSIGPRLPIHLGLPGNVSSRNFRTGVAKWGGAPSCWKYKLLKSGRLFNAMQAQLQSSVSPGSLLQKQFQRRIQAPQFLQTIFLPRQVFQAGSVQLW